MKSKKQWLGYIDQLGEDRTVLLKKGDRLNGLSLDNVMKTIGPFINNYENDGIFLLIMTGYH